MLGIIGAYVVLRHRKDAAVEDVIETLKKGPDFLRRPFSVGGQTYPLQIPFGKPLDSDEATIDKEIKV